MRRRIARLEFHAKPLRDSHGLSDDQRQNPKNHLATEQILVREESLECALVKIVRNFELRHENNYSDAANNGKHEEPAEQVQVIFCIEARTQIDCEKSGEQ